MKKNILYVLSSYNKFGGTPKKTLDLIKNSENNSFLYVWSTTFSKEFKNDFVDVCEKVFEGNYYRNIYNHVKYIISIIDLNNIDIIQTQFFFGNFIIGLVKLFRPKVKVVVTFEGSMPVFGYRKIILNFIFKRVDAFIFISEYVKNEQFKTFPILKEKESIVIYNGATKRLDNKEKIKTLKSISLVSVAALLDLKNIPILIKALAILKEKRDENIYLYVAGEGSARKKLEKKIKKYNLEEYVFLLGNQSNIGGLLDQCDIFVHPSYKEGFGIAVAEAMFHERPLIVSNAGALPEIVKNNETGLMVDPFNAQEWVDAIIKIIENPNLAKRLAKNAVKYAETEFSMKRCATEHDTFYEKL
jgi:glycosyltransferase involved in cell wall biosynthesis